MSQFGRNPVVCGGITEGVPWMTEAEALALLKSIDGRRTGYWAIHLAIAREVGARGILTGPEGLFAYCVGRAYPLWLATQETEMQEDEYLEIIAAQEAWDGL